MRLGSPGCGRGGLYRPVSLRSPTTHSRARRGAPRGDRGSEVVGAPGALRDGVPGPGPQGALLRPGLLRSWRSSSCGRASGRWRAGSRRSPRPRDFVEYEFLDQSIIVLRTDDMGVRAFQNACRHRGVKVVEGQRDVRERVHVPVPRLVLRPRRHEHARHAAEDVRRAQPAAGRHQPHAGAVRGVGRVRVDQPRRRRAAVAAVHRARARTILDAWKVESLRTE